MSFYREKIIKNPKKDYTCEWCGSTIKGKHMYLAGMTEDGFQAFRVHIKCHCQVTKMCGECSDSDDCRCRVDDCLYEEKRLGRIKD